MGLDYQVELVHLPGHTPGQCGFYDLHNKTLFCGDTNGIASAIPGEPFAEYCTVTALRNALKKLEPRYDQIEGIFPGHGMLDLLSSYLQNILETCENVISEPLRFDRKVETIRNGVSMDYYMRFIYEGSSIRYTMHNIE